MKTAMQELVEKMSKDQVSFTDWFIDNYQVFIEKEKEQIIQGFKSGMNYEQFSIAPNWNNEWEEYYNQTYNQNK